MRHALRLGIHNFSFHVFDCAPGPKLEAVEVTSVDEHEAWDYHSGDLSKAEITAHVSVIGAGLIEDLLPHRNVWFDPNAAPASPAEEPLKGAAVALRFALPQ